MRCPWCGSEPVRITGNHWECGWCGDSGFLRRRSVPTQKTVQVKLSFSLSYHVDLAESWADLKKALGQLMPDQSQMCIRDRYRCSRSVRKDSSLAL